MRQARIASTAAASCGSSEVHTGTSGAAARSAATKESAGIGAVITRIAMRRFSRTRRLAVGACSVLRREPELLDQALVLRIGLARPRGVLLAAAVPHVLVQLVEQLEVLRVVHRLLEGVVQRLDDGRVHALRADQAVRRVADDV